MNGNMGRWYIAIIAFLGGLLIAGVPILVSLQGKTSRSDVVDLIAKQSPYAADREFVRGTLDRLDLTQQNIVARLTMVESRLATLEAEAGQAGP
jgi:hypothetical protein